MKAPNLSKLDTPAVVPSLGSPSRQSDNSVYFRFIHMNQPTCMLYSRGWESFKYCGIVSIVFFLWVFSYGILSSLNSQTPNMTKQTLTQVVSVLAVFFVGYLFGPLLVGQWVLQQFRVQSHADHGAGHLLSRNAHILAFGATRLLIAQGVQTVASLFSGLLSRSIFSVSIPSTRWTYLGCALVVALLALFFYYMPLPEASDSELHSQAEDLKTHHSEKYPGTFTEMFTNFVLFFFALFILSSSTQSIDIFFTYLLAIISKMTGATQTFSTNNIYIFGTGMFAFRRFFVPSRVFLSALEF